MQISEREIKRLTRALKRHAGIRAAFLFGSQATGNARKQSDVDVAILTDANLSKTDQARVDIAAFRTITHELDRNDVDVVTINEAPTMLRYAATVHGRPLFVRQGHDTRRLRFRALREFEDFRPYLERHSRALKRRLLAV